MQSAAKAARFYPPTRIDSREYPVRVRARARSFVMRDRDVRDAVRHMLAMQHAGDANTRIVEEMGVWSGSCRIDLAVINGELSGYELKSDSDTLERLPAQVAMYERVFDRLTLVSGAKHIDKAVSLIPEWWGVVQATEGVDGSLTLEQRREPRLNPRPDPVTISQLLWRDEALAVLDALGLAKGWRSKTAPAIHRHLATTLAFEQLTEVVRTTLKRRPNWLGQTVGD